MSYFIWVPICFIFYVIYSLVSKQNQILGGKWFWITLLMGAFPGWAIVSRYTKNILQDGLIYDLIMIIAFPITMIWIGEAKNFIWTQWLGLVLTIGGLVLMKL